jgi:nucleoredoxin
MTDAMTTFTSQFGETLYKSSDNTTTTPSNALTGKDYVLLYFSAHWCPPCRRFTPILIEFYNKMKEDKNIELVFCSLDHKEEEYKDYTSSMPWLSMPFNAKETKVMASKYDAKGIPHLVVVDGKTGELITKDGTEGVREDSEGAKFPWRPKSFADVWPSQILANKDTATAENKLLDTDSLKDKYLMLYFSAHWCPPCRAFTPKLSEAYTKLKAERDDFELVFISSDKDEAQFNEYFGEMSFCALPYELRDEKAALSKVFEVSGIPQLSMVGPVSDDGSGNRPLINKNIRSFIESESFSDFPFYKKNYGSVDGADEIGEVKSMIIFHENGDDEEQEEIKNIVKALASKVKESEKYKDMNIHWALSNKGLGERIRSVTKLPAMSEEPTMIILDIPDSNAYYKSSVTDITVESAMAFIEDSGERFEIN